MVCFFVRKTVSVLLIHYLKLSRCIFFHPSQNIDLFCILYSELQVLVHCDTDTDTVQVVVHTVD